MGLFNRTIPKANEWWSLHWARALELELGTEGPIQSAIDRFIATDYFRTKEIVIKKLDVEKSYKRLLAEIKKYEELSWFSR